MELRAESVYKNILRNDPSMTILLPSIALLIATVFGAPPTTAFAADDPFKNKVSIEIDEDNKNTCDELDNGKNNAECIIALTKNTGPISVQKIHRKAKIGRNLPHRKPTLHEGQ